MFCDRLRLCSLRFFQSSTRYGQVRRGVNSENLSLWCPVGSLPKSTRILGGPAFSQRPIWTARPAGWSDGQHRLPNIRRAPPRPHLTRALLVNIQWADEFSPHLSALCMATNRNVDKSWGAAGVIQISLGAVPAELCLRGGIPLVSPASTSATRHRFWECKPAARADVSAGRGSTALRSFLLELLRIYLQFGKYRGHPCRPPRHNRDSFISRRRQFYQL
jgi:hypothetical protein